jgi:RNA polymerase sigma-70 factor (ECF subfamily)
MQNIEHKLHAQWMQAQTGDAASYEKVLHTLSVYLRNFLRRRLFSRHQDIEDLVQETLLAIHLKRHTYLPDQPLTAWVYAIARYKLIDHLRTQSRQDNKHDDIDDWVDALWVDSDTNASDARHDVAYVLSLLPDKQRRLIEHTQLEGLSAEETALLTGQSITNVKVSVHRGLKRLAHKLGVPT